MRSKPAASLTLLSFLCVLLALPARGQEPPPPAEPETPAPETPLTPPETPKKEEGFFKSKFGSRFALYLEVAYGMGQSDAVETSVKSGIGAYTINDFTIDDLTGGRLTVGWTLPEERGRFALTMNGFAENSFKFDGIGYATEVQTLPGSPAPTETAPPLRWWTTHIENGALRSVRNPPYWQDNPDAPDSIIDPDEIFYLDPDLIVSKSVAKSVQNRAQTWDLYYQRDFGGRQYSVTWTAGARYFIFDGTVPSAAWLVAPAAIPGVGYSDGVAVPIALFRQKTSGYGPSGSAEFRMKYFRSRLTIYFRGSAAFLVETLSADSGSIFPMVRQDTGLLVPFQTVLRKEVDQSVWQLGGEAGLRGRLAPGFDLYAAWSISAYTDAILSPSQILIPDLDRRIPLGISALYKTRDLVFQQVMLGLAFQF